MLGDLLSALTRPAHASDLLAQIAAPALIARVQARATKDGVPEGDCIAATVRHVIDHGDEALWLDLIGCMSGSLQPGAAALQLILARAFPDPVRVQIRRTPA